jgi:LPS-assembly protein
MIGFWGQVSGSCGPSCELFRPYPVKLNVARSRPRACNWLASKHKLTFLILVLIPLFFRMSADAQIQAPAAPGIVQLEAKQQRREGNRTFADGDVDLRYENMRLRADHVDYDASTYEVMARGNVKFDYNNQHVESTQANYNIRSEQGSFFKASGTVTVNRRPNPNVLFSTNPIYFEADEVDRLSDQVYQFKRSWLTICIPNRPVWKFFAARATLTLDQKVALVNANFRVFRVPLLYLPYASVPAGRKLRQSGFTIPEFGSSPVKGTMLSDSYYWAPTDWLDAEVSAQFLSLRGWSQGVDLRAVPSGGARIFFHYFGLEDRGLLEPNGNRVSQGGHEMHFRFDDTLLHGWRAVADINELSSLIFRLAFATTFNEATVTEIHSAGFLTNNFRGFSLNIAALDYKNYLNACTDPDVYNECSSSQPETSIVIRDLPEVRFSSTDQAPWSRWPVYFGFDSFSGAVQRIDPNLQTGIVERSEISPRVTLPLHWNYWLGVSATAAFRTTDYDAQFINGQLSNQNLVRNTGEITLDLRPFSLERVWSGLHSKWKHTIEPDFVYNYVTGVQDFSRIIRFDQDDTLTNTNEVQYSLTQRLFRKRGDGQAQEVVSWRLAQKHYFDPTFGGALVPGQRNVFVALDSITPFAFADSPRYWSPLVSTLKTTFGGRYDLEQETDYDSTRRQVTALGTIATIRPYGQSFISVSHFDIRTNPPLEPRYNQIRTTVGWGQMTRKGWNTAVAIGYDAQADFLQYELVQASYNGSCCGISFEYRRLALGAGLPSDNQFRAALLIANFGTFGTLRRQERVF